MEESLMTAVNKKDQQWEIQESEGLTPEEIQRKILIQRMKKYITKIINDPKTKMPQLFKNDLLTLNLRSDCQECYDYKDDESMESEIRSWLRWNGYKMSVSGYSRGKKNFIDDISICYD